MPTILPTEVQFVCALFGVPHIKPILNSKYVLTSGMHLCANQYCSKIVWTIASYFCLFPYKSKIGLVRICRGSLHRREQSSQKCKHTRPLTIPVACGQISSTTFATVYTVTTYTCLYSLMPRPHPPHARTGSGYETNVSAYQNTCDVICYCDVNANTTNSKSQQNLIALCC